MNSSDPFNFPELPDSSTHPAPSEEPIRVVIHKPWPTWGFLDLVFLVISLVLVSFIAIPIVLSLARLLPAYAHQSMRALSANTLLLIPAQAVIYLLWLGPIWLIVTPKAGEPLLRALRWRWPGRRQIMILVGLGAALSLLIEYGSALLPVPKHLPIESYFQTTAEAYATALFGILVAPFFEELFFRGLLYPWLRARTGLALAIPLSALSFALMHSPQLGRAWAPLLLIFLVGIVLTVVRERSDSLAASWAVHVAYNGTLFLTSFIATGGFKHLE